MKKTIMLLMLVFLTTGAVFAQSSKTKQISKKWVINKEAMRPIITKLLMTSPKMGEFNKEMREITIENAVSMISRLKMDIRTTGAIVVQNDVGKDMGTWKFSSDETKMYTQSSDGKTKEQFLVETLTNSKLVLVGPKDVKLIFRRL